MAKQIVGLNELYETTDWKQLEAWERDIESRITEMTILDYLGSKARIKIKGNQIAKQYGYDHGYIPSDFNPRYPGEILSANEEEEYRKRHSSAITSAFLNYKPIEGWILRENYPEFLDAVEKSGNFIEYRMTHNGQAGYYQLKA